MERAGDASVSLVVIGDSLAGKTSVVQRYIHGRPPAESYAPTVMDQFAYAVNVGDRTIQVHLWDTQMWQNVDADCYLLCFDLSDMSALARIQDKWCGLLQARAKDTPFVVVGCRSDLRERGVDCIDTETAALVAEGLDAWGYIECSARTGDKVKDLFDNVVLCALEGQAESRAAATTTTAPTVQATPPGQRTTAEETKKGKEKANDNDEAENEVQPDEGKFTRPGLSTDEKEKWENFHYWNVFGMENWYPLLKDFTFPTTLLPLSQEEALAFVDYQERALKSLDQADLPPVTSPVLKHLETRLEGALEDHPCGAFVKLSDRCPKDGATGNGRIQQHLDAAIENVTERNITSNQYGLCALYTALHRAMRVESAEEALKLLLISFRTLEDVKKRLEYRERTWSLCVAVRQWVDFAPAMQFRGFVYQGRLNALSQYFYDCYFPVLQRHKDKIEASLVSFWQSFREKVPYKSYVVDLAILPCDLDQADPLPVRIIEFNPFDYYTDAAMFNWLADKQTFREGPFEFRINETAAVVGSNVWWIKLMKKHLAERNTNNRA